MRRINTFIINLIIIIAFTEGAISLIGPSESTMRTLRELLIIFLFFFSFLQKNYNGCGMYGNAKKFWYYGIGYILLFLIVSTISVIVNEQTGIEFFIFLLRVFPPILFFWTLLKINFKIDKVISTLKFMVILQIPAVIIKYFVIGISESGGIGMMSIHSGSLSTIFPLFVISYIFSLYLTRKNKKYIILIFLFILFGLIGGKRALIVYIPLLLLFILIIYRKAFHLKSKTNFTKQFLGLFILGFISFYFIARFNPNLNPEQKIGGSFDLEYIMGISTAYNTATYELGFSRFDAPQVLFNFLSNNGGSNLLLLGVGPGDIIQSSLNNIYPGVENDRQLLMYKYGLGYGLRVGVLWTAIQVGILGTIIYIIFFYSIFKKVYKILKKTKDKITKEYCMGFLGMSFMFALDYFTYSATFIYSGSIYILFFITLVVVLKRYSRENSH